MARSRSFWLAGLLVGAALAAAVPSGSPLADLRLLVFGAGLLPLGLLGEAVALAAAARRGRRRAAVSDTRPADGRVELTTIRGVVGETNAVDPRFRRFLATDAAATAGAIAPERSSPPLIGKVVLISLFIGRDGRAWSDAEIVRAHASLEKAGAWIEGEAIRWGQPVNVALADTYFAVRDDHEDEVAVGFVPEGDDVGPWEDRAATKALIGVTRAAVGLGFRDAADLVAQVGARVDADVRVWIVHPRRAGRSMAVPLDRTELAGVALAICYAREASFPEPLDAPPAPDSATIAHELLHLFGATDKYGRPLDAFPAGSVSACDIMRLGYDTLRRLRIDLLTASEIGWREAGDARAERP